MQRVSSSDHTTRRKKRRGTKKFSYLRCLQSPNCARAASQKTAVIYYTTSLQREPTRNPQNQPRTNHAQSMPRTGDFAIKIQFFGDFQSSLIISRENAACQPSALQLCIRLRIHHNSRLAYGEKNLCGKPNSALIALLRPLHPLHYTPKHNNERHTRLQDHSESS